MPFGGLACSGEMLNTLNMSHSLYYCFVLLLKTINILIQHPGLFPNYFGIGLLFFRAWYFLPGRNIISVNTDGPHNAASHQSNHHAVHRAYKSLKQEKWLS